ncbi:protein dead ringer isoform X2 [Contarinia nasturtii]|uniref:protein dead ringer isoform X2 n=1 Tax=Contarinia nasturtii TaxID=265458 RepID=UPI0012D3755D|nr:protein dead ringer isoform X2 [Contarinia nasturtii]
MDERRIDRDSDLGDDSPMVSSSQFITVKKERSRKGGMEKKPPSKIRSWALSQINLSNSHADEHSDREEDEMMREECESSDEGVNLNAHTNETETALDFATSPKRSPSNTTNISSHHSVFGPSHALSMLSNFMGVPNLQNLQNLPHSDVLEKLKMQVGLMDPEFAMQSLRNLNTPPNSSFTMPQGTDATSTTSANQPHNLSALQTSQKNFSFTTPNAPNAPNTKDGNLESNSSTSSDASNSSQQNNGWSFEEQFKQVRQLYEISDEPKRKEFLDDLFHFMQRRGTPINRLPIMAKSVLDLYELYNLVIARGGLVDVINKKLWQEIIKGLHLPSSITSAAFTLRTQYMKYLYPYECEKKNLSTPAELQAAIDGNRREGRRSSYGQFDSQMQGQLQQLVQRSPLPGGLPQMSPLSLVSQNPHHRLLQNQQMGLIPNQMTEMEQRMLEYIKLIQSKDVTRPQSPECIRSDTLSALEMSRVALWSMYNNNTSPPTSNNTTSPPTNEPQREALNLTESPTHVIKREREAGTDYDREDYVMPSKKAALHQLHTQLQSQRDSPHNHYNHEHRRRSVSPSSPNRHRNRSMERDHGHEHRNGLLSFHDNQNHTSTRRHMSASPPNHRNGTNNNGSNDLLNACSPLALLSGMQFKLFSRGSESGEQQLVVSMELNGVQYEGVLFANRVNAQSASPSTSSPPCTPSKITPTTTSSGASASSPMVEDRSNRVVPTVSRPLVSS